MTPPPDQIDQHHDLDLTGEEPSNQDLIVSRRRVLGIVGAAGASAFLAACGRGASSETAAASGAGQSTTTTAAAASGASTTSTTVARPSSPSTTAAPATTPSCVITPQETAGPYPLDLHTNSAFFRRDITEGKPGVPLAVTLTILDSSCQPLVNARVDIWQTDKDGVYSGYSQPGANTVGQTFCRGIQLTDAKGQVTFDTVYPGWYPGRITHIHFQVYLNNGLVATSQLAFPQDLTQAVYASSLYAGRGQNTSVRSFAQDGVFRDGAEAQMLEMEGTPSSGYRGSLVVGVRT